MSSTLEYLVQAKLMHRGYLWLAFRLCYGAVRREHRTQQSRIHLSPEVLNIPDYKLDHALLSYC